MRLDDPVELRVPVAAREEQRAVREVREARAEDVEARVDPRGCMDAGGRVVDGGPREVVNRKALGRCVPDGVEGEHLAVREERDVDADDGPGLDRPPLADLARIRCDGGGTRRCCPCGPDPSPMVELRLGRGGVDDRVLRLVALRGVDVVREAGAGSAEQGREHQRDEGEPSTHRQAANKTCRNVHRDHHPTAPAAVQLCELPVLASARAPRIDACRPSGSR
jgi:hypothetical protein